MTVAALEMLHGRVWDLVGDCQQALELAATTEVSFSVVSLPGNLERTVSLLITHSVFLLLLNSSTTPFIRSDAK
jgi:hypothetical protein